MIILPSKWGEFENPQHLLDAILQIGIKNHGGIWSQNSLNPKLDETTKTVQPNPNSL